MDAIGRVTRRLVHDFNNLLTGILGYSAMLRGSLPPGSEEYEAAVYIERAARKASDLTGELKAFYRREVGQAGPVDVHRAIEEAVGMLCRSARASVRVRTSLSAARAIVSGDAGALVRAFVNLGTNADESMAEGGTISISTENVSRERAGLPRGEGIAEEYLCVRVTDTGCGIPELMRLRVFEPFHTTKPSGARTGFGLSEVYGCVRRHDGFIALDSDEGVGTTVRLLFPVARAGAGRVEVHPLGETGRSEKPSLPGGNETLLVVASDDTLLRLTCDALRALGYTPLPAPALEDGLEIYRTNPDRIDAVIVGMSPPETSVDEASPEFRRVRPAARVIPLPRPFDLLGLAYAVRASLDR